MGFGFIRDRSGGIHWDESSIPWCEERCPQWLGPIGTVEGPIGDQPVRWNEQTHICWKTTIPGLGHATLFAARAVVACPI